MKVGIVTIYDIKPNYGNKLQNYATCHVLNELNFDVRTFVTQPQEPIWKSIIKIFLGYLQIGRFKFQFSETLKMIKFNRFNKKYLKPSTELLSGKLNQEEYDYFVLGSDQVWNPRWYFSIKEEAFLLKFCDDKKKVTFSPSFGCDEIPDEYEEIFHKYLSKIPLISVREESGITLVNKLTGKDAELLIDPTLMLSKEEWFKIFRKKKLKSKPYILTYFLGTKSKSTLCDIKKYSEKYDCVIIDIMDKSNSKYYSCGPDEFLYLISNAKLVLTDSYHACVFSFLFSKPFLVYARDEKNDMIGRITTLLSEFGLERKYINSNLENEVMECDYSYGHSLLFDKRQKVIDFLKKSMHIGEV